MANNDNKKVLALKEGELQIVVPAELRAAKYANAVNVDANDSEVTIDFIYVNQRDNPKGTLVSRVVIARPMLKQITDGFVNLTEVAGRK